MFVLAPGGDYADVGVGGGGELAQEAATAVVDGEGGGLLGGADVHQQISFFGPVTEVGIGVGFADQGRGKGNRIVNVFDRSEAAAAGPQLRPGDIFAGDIDARIFEVLGAVIDAVDAGADGEVLFEEGDCFTAAGEGDADVGLRGAGRIG